MGYRIIQAVCSRIKYRHYQTQNSLPVSSRLQGYNDAYTSVGNISSVLLLRLSNWISVVFMILNPPRSPLVFRLSDVPLMFRDLLVGVKVVDLPLVVGTMVVKVPSTFFATIWKQGRITIMVAAIIPTNSSTMATVLDKVEAPGYRVS